MGNAYSQSNPPAPSFTEENLPDLTGKCYIVTGGNGGVGKELVRMLYGNHGKVYIATRSKDKTSTAIDEIRQQCPSSRGSLHFLMLDLSDLSTIKRAVNEFLETEDRLDVLWNNAGIMVPGPNVGPTPQGHDLQMATNCLGPFLFTQLLTPILKKTAETSPQDSVRVAWAASIGTDLFAPQYGMDIDTLGEPSTSNQGRQYAETKVGNIFLANAFSKKAHNDGVIHVAFNPGNLKTDLQRNLASFATKMMQPILFEAKFGAYTELYCGFSPDLKLGDIDAYIIPWGRVSRPRNDFVQAMKPLNEKGKNYAERFYKWCEKETSSFS